MSAATARNSSPAHLVIERPAPAQSDAASNAFTESDIERWLGEKATTTAAAYRAGIRALQRSIGAPSPAAAAGTLLHPTAGPRAIAEFRAALRADLEAGAISAATANLRLAACAALSRHAAEMGLPAPRLEFRRFPARPYRDTAGPDISIVRRLFAAARADADRCRGCRDEAMLALLARRGLRRGEVAALDTTDLERNGSARPAAVYIRAKGHTERQRVSIPAAAGEALLRWLAVRPADASTAALFIPTGRGRSARTRGARLTTRSLANALAALARRAGLPGLRPHQLRHFAVTAALETGASIRDAAAFARHADIRTTTLYDDARADIGGRVAETLSAAIGTGGE